MPSPTFRARFMLIALGCASVFTGCNKPSDGGGAGSGPTQLAARRNSYIADVPTPADFIINEHKSMNRVFPNARLVDHVYEGPGEAQAVRGFYATQMPAQKWQPLAETLKDAEYILRYTKGGEYCEIRVKRGGTGSLFRPIQVRVLIEPHQESGAKSP